MNNEQDMDNEKNESTTKIASIDFNNHFKLPIYYNNEKNILITCNCFQFSFL